MALRWYLYNLSFFVCTDVGDALPSFFCQGHDGKYLILELDIVLESLSEMFL